jgi:CRP-like cAMP-binding protein
MQSDIRQDTTPNRILSAMSAEDFDILKPSLTFVDLPPRRQLETANTRIDHVYFIEHGVASVVASTTRSRSIEVGLIGHEGMTGLAVILQTDRSPHETFMQGGGSGQRIEAVQLCAAMNKSPALSRLLLRYAFAVSVQMAFTVLSNGRSNLEERLARWLLMARDRADNDDLSLTHEFLALMLAVRRATVTVTIQKLEERGVIASKRGVISIVDRTGLEAAANGTYGAPEAEFQRLLGAAGSGDQRS